MGELRLHFGVQQRMLLFNRRFGFEYINGGPGDGAAVQGICKRIAVHHRAAGRIDEDGAFFIIESSFSNQSFVSGVRGVWRETISQTERSSSRGT